MNKTLSTKLAPSIVLRRLNDIELKVNGTNSIQIKANNNKIIVGNEALQVLQLFAQPIVLKDAIKQLGATSSTHWVEMVNVIHVLYKIGALVDAQENSFQPDTNMASFGAAPIHIKMLNDRVRTDAFIKAIGETVKAGDVVVDIGTGTGVLAIAAARAGASKVYAIEAGAMADVAQAVINKTEVADKITVIRGWSTQIELPELADVLVGEIIGNDPFDENVLPVYADAKKRLLKPNAKILPELVKAFVLPIQLPANMLLNKNLTDAYLSNWKQWYGTDFSDLKKVGVDHTRLFSKISTQKAKKLPIVGPPIFLTEVDLTNSILPDKEITIEAYTEGACNGLLLYFELNIGSGIITTHPTMADETNSWLNPVWHLPELANKGNNAIFSIVYKWMDVHSATIEIVAVN
jgi:16S rRNA G966 N2-methylase RsmD